MGSVKDGHAVMAVGTGPAPVQPVPAAPMQSAGRGSKADIADRLGPDLAELVARFGPALVAAEPVTTLPSDRLQRASYRLLFADGRVLKGRRLATAADAERVSSILEQLSLPALSEVAARRGGAILEPWVDGAPLVTEAVASDVLVACGLILAQIHAAVLQPGLPLPSPR